MSAVSLHADTSVPAPITFNGPKTKDYRKYKSKRPAPITPDSPLPDFEAREHELSDSRAEFIPTADEIREACAEIQAGWSKAERLSRAGVALETYYKGTVDGRSILGRRPVAFTVPEVSVRGGVR